MRALEVAHKLGATYADLRVVRQESQNIETKDLTVASFTRGTASGIGVRVLCGGWGFASTQVFTAKAVEKVVKLAVAAAKASAHCLDKEVELAPEPRYNATWVSPHLVDPFTVSDDEKLAVLVDCARTMLAVKGVTLARGSLSFVREKKLFVSMHRGQLHSHIDQTFIRTGCGIEANAKDDNDQQKRSWPNSAGGQFENAGWEMVARWQLKENAQRIAEEAVALLTAPQCPSGIMNAVIGASQVGLQTHESTGHPSELDRAIGQEANFAGRSFLTTGMLGHLRYGSDIVNLVADATQHGGLGGFAFDDEGVAAQAIPLVTGGIFTGYLSSRDTAPLIGLSRSGGCLRAESPHYQPIIRMTNINLLPGKGSLEDLIAQCGDGVLMECNKSWSIDDRRYNFQFGMEIGWLIKGGKLQGIVKNPSYSGITTEFWGSCAAIGGPETYVIWGVPNCGKGQPMQTMHTGHGAAPVLFRNIKVGIAHASGSGEKR
jgi:TldD protein